MNNDVQYFYINAEEAGQRLDNYLFKKLKGVPKPLIYKIIRGGEVRVNKKRAKPLSRVEEGDAIRVPPIRTRDPKEEVTPETRLRQQTQWAWLEQHILHEEDAYLILNKPSGLAVHGGSGVSLGVVEMLQRLRPKCQTLELGHRLDKETSGCLLVAKKRSFLRLFHQLLREKKVVKEYNALLVGTWQGKKVCEINLPLLKNVAQSGERIVKVSDEGKEAKTYFELIKNFKEACWVKALPVTGRTHQIRVHALHMGHPIVGDEKYGQYEVNKTMRALGCSRLYLHAQSLKFTLPEDRGTCYFEAPLDEKMQDVIKKLEKNNE